MIGPWDRGAGSHQCEGVPALCLQGNAEGSHRAGLGNKDEAFAWLRKGVAVRDIDMIALKIELYWDELRSDPRFEDLLRQVGFPPSKP